MRKFTARIAPIGFMLALAMFVSPAEAEQLSLFEDDFNDGVIDTSLWQSWGAYGVYETAGQMRCEMVRTDRGGSITALPFLLASREPIVVRRSVYVHPQNQYFRGHMSFNPVEAPEYRFTMNYATYAYHTSRFCPYEGFRISRNGADVGYCAQQVDLSPRVDPIWNQWFDETVVYDPESGWVEWYLNGDLVLEYFVGVLPQSVTAIQMSFSGYGWWTGHKHYFDNLSVTQESVLLTPEEMAVELSDDVASLPLPRALLNSYDANLKKVEDFLARGQSVAAYNQVNAFMRKLSRDAARGSVDRDIARDLLDQAQQLLDAIAAL